MARPTDPYAVFRYVVEIDGNEVGGFSHVGGLERDTTTDEIREGGVNDFVHKLANVTKHPNLTLRRGLTEWNDLWRWHQEVIEGRIRRRTISVILKGSDRSEKRRWIFADAYPVKWSGGELDAATSQVAVETVEFVHRGLRLQ